ncbi:tripartite tricarboxylate transporter TctB family protein [Filobacillus milosensis]|uniref:tripartite tricarboxylate transporter TctB family protein n=1 Tax=Filobacillus milosensis TaxID=94137 RepID=UPI0018919A00|nr:tripartite tricarboxylate transporter TctB family protein [Filobacillus milosensis]
MGELILGLLLVLLSILIYTQTGDLPSMNESQLDAGSFPQFIAILLGLLSLILVIKQSIHLLKQNQNKEQSANIKETLLDVYREHKLVLITLSLIFLYIILIQIIGFIISSIAFMIITALVIGPRKKKDVITISSIAVILTIGLYFFFQNVLQVRFPSGVFF